MNQNSEEPNDLKNIYSEIKKERLITNNLITDIIDLRDRIEEERRKKTTNNIIAIIVLLICVFILFLIGKSFFIKYSNNLLFQSAEILVENKKFDEALLMYEKIKLVDNGYPGLDEKILECKYGQVVSAFNSKNWQFAKEISGEIIERYGNYKDIEKFLLASAENEILMEISAENWRAAARSLIYVSDLLPNFDIKKYTSKYPKLDHEYKLLSGTLY